MQQRVLYGVMPKVHSARVIRTDGLFIKKFDYEELCRGTDYFERWIDTNLFNIEKIEDDDKYLTYWVS